MTNVKTLLKTPVVRDLLILALICIVFLILSYNFDLMELFYSFSRDHEGWELDELAPLFIFFGWCMVIFNWRRWQENHRINIQLKAKNNALNNAISEIKRLKGLLPICSSCKKIRDDQGYWQQVEQYIQDHSEATFSHSMCPDCIQTYYGDEFVLDNYEKNIEKI